MPLAMRAQHSNFEAEAEWKLQMLLQCACFFVSVYVLLQVLHAPFPCIMCCPFECLHVCVLQITCALHMLHVWFSYHCCHKHSKCPSSSVPDPINHFDAFASINFLQRLLCHSLFYTFFYLLSHMCVCVTARAPSLLLPHLVFFRIKSEFACF